MILLLNTRLSLFVSLSLIFLATVWCGKAAESEKAVRTISQQDFALDGEIAQLKEHPWAGKYSYGDGMSVNITVSIAPENGFVFHWHGCLGEYGKNYGAVEVANGLLKLSPVLPNDAKPFRDLSVPYQSVIWGKRRYLMATNEMIEFCNAINGRSEPRESALGMFLLRLGDEKKPVDGKPELPKEYRRYLLEKPIEVAITKVSETTRKTKDDFMKEFAVELDGGSRNGLFAGMELHFADKDYFGLIKVKTVDATNAEAVIEVLGKDENLPAVGLKLTTLPPWHKP